MLNTFFILNFLSRLQMIRLKNLALHCAVHDIAPLTKIVCRCWLALLFSSLSKPRGGSISDMRFNLLYSRLSDFRLWSKTMTCSVEFCLLMMLLCFLIIPQYFKGTFFFQKIVISGFYVHCLKSLFKDTL